MFLSILRSLLITFSISSVIAYAAVLASYNFWLFFACSTAIQFVFHWSLGYVMSILTLLRNKQLENQRIAEFSKQSVNVNCAYCRHANTVPVRFEDYNDFTCENCEKSNAIYVNLTVTQKTTPLNLKPVSINTVDDQEQVVISQIRERGQ